MCQNNFAEPEVWSKAKEHELMNGLQGVLSFIMMQSVLLISFKAPCGPQGGKLWLKTADVLGVKLRPEVRRYQALMSWSSSVLRCFAAELNVTEFIVPGTQPHVEDNQVIICWAQNHSVGCVLTLTIEIIFGTRSQATLNMQISAVEIPTQSFCFHFGRFLFIWICCLKYFTNKSRCLHLQHRAQKNRGVFCSSPWDADLYSLGTTDTSSAIKVPRIQCFKITKPNLNTHLRPVVRRIRAILVA